MFSTRIQVNSVRILVALVLFLAGLAKISGLGSLHSNAILFACLAVVELVMSIWLISGWHLIDAWRAATLFFACTTLYGVISVSFGNMTCQCFGSPGLSIWYSITLSVCSVGLLSFLRHSVKECASANASASSIWLAGGIAFLMAGAGQHIPLPAVLASILEKPGFQVDPFFRNVELDLIRGGDLLIPVVIKNTSKIYDLTIVGCRSTDCTQSAELTVPPFWIPAGESVKCSIRLFRPNQESVDKIENILLAEIKRRKELGNDYLSPFSLHIELLAGGPGNALIVRSFSVSAYVNEECKRRILSAESVSNHAVSQVEEDLK